MFKILAIAVAVGTLVSLQAQSSLSETLEMNSTTSQVVTGVTVTTTNPETEVTTSATPGVTTAPADVTAPDPDEPATNPDAQMADLTVAPEECVAELSVTKSSGLAEAIPNVDMCGLAALVVEDIAETDKVYIAPPGEEEGYTEESLE
jgi:hypothetical protein